jgi:hypothetical protein
MYKRKYNNSIDPVKRAKCEINDGIKKEAKKPVSVKK